MARTDKALNLAVNMNLNADQVRAELTRLTGEIARMQGLISKFGNTINPDTGLTSLQPGKIGNAAVREYQNGNKNITRELVNDLNKIQVMLGETLKRKGELEQALKQITKIQLDGVEDVGQAKRSEHTQQLQRIRREAQAEIEAQRVAQAANKTAHQQELAAMKERLRMIDVIIGQAKGEAVQAKTNATIKEQALREENAQLTEQLRLRRLNAQAARDEANAEAAAIRRSIAEQRLQNIRNIQQQRRGLPPVHRFGGIAGQVQLPGGGLSTGILGMAGANLYGAGVVGLGTVGVRSAMEAYSESYNLKVMLAGVIQTFGEFRDSAGNILQGMEKYEKSRDFADQLYSKLRRKAVESPVTFQDLSQGYLVAAPYLAKSGLNFDQSIEVSNLLVTLGKMQNLPLKSIVDDIRALSTGRLTNAQTLQTMGFTKEDMGKLKELRGDDLYDFLMQKGSGFKDAIKEFEGSFTVAWDRMLDSFYTMRIKFGEKLAKPLGDFAKNITATLQQWELDGTLDRFTKTAQSVMDKIGSLGKFVVENFEKMVGLVEWWIGYKLADTVVKAIATMVASAQVATTGGSAASAIAKNGILGMAGVGGRAALAWAASNPIGAGAVAIGTLAAGYMWWQTKEQENQADALDARATANQYINNPGNGQDARAAIADQLRAYIDKGVMPKVPTDRELNSLQSNEQIGEFLARYRLGSGAALREIQKAQRTRPDGSRDSVRRVQQAYYPNYSSYDDVLTYINTMDQNSRGNLLSKGVLWGALSATDKGGVVRRIMRNKSFAGEIDNPNFLTRSVAIPGTTGAMFGASGATGSADNVKAILQARIKALDPAPAIPNQPSGVNPPGTGNSGSGGGVSSVTMEADVSAEERLIGELEMANAGIDHSLGKKLARDYAERIALAKEKFANAKKIAETQFKIAEKKASRVVETVVSGKGGPLSGQITGSGTSRTKGTNPFNPFDADVTPEKGTKGDLKLQNKATKDSVAMAKAEAELASTLQTLGFSFEEEVGRYWEEYTQYIEQVRLAKLDLRSAILQFARGADLTSNDPERAYGANLELLKLDTLRIAGANGGMGGGIAGLMTGMMNMASPAGMALMGKFGQLNAARKDALRQQVAAANAQRFSNYQSSSLQAFQRASGAIGLEGLGLASYDLNQRISQAEGVLQKPINGPFQLAAHEAAKKLLEGLYKLRASIEKNNAIMQRNLEVRLQAGTEAIFNTGERLSPTAAYRKQFDTTMSNIDMMTDSEVIAKVSATSLVGPGLANNYNPATLRQMLKLDAMRGFTARGFQKAMYNERGIGMVSAVTGALSSGQDPLQALLGARGKGPGDDALARLTEDLFSRNVYKDGKFNKTKDLISGGGSFLANLLVQQGAFGKNNYSNEGSQIGGMLASMGAFSQLGAFAGPVGILGGALIGSLFGKKRPEDPAIAQHRKNLEELLKTISNRLKPQEDFYRTIRGDAIWGSASRLYRGGGSTLGARASLGVL